MNMEQKSAAPLPECPEGTGTLPPCAGLSVPYVPDQPENPGMYPQTEALSNGTLFPGLNLPFFRAAEGSKVPDTPLAELQAIRFVVLELGTYLDTHPEDREAFGLFQQYVEMERKVKAVYEKRFGPLTRSASAADDHYTWLEKPWPWCYEQNEVK